MLAVPASASIVASAGPANNYSRALLFPGTGVYSVGWSQTSTYSSVAISIAVADYVLVTGGASGTITAYLTDQVGATTTMLLNELVPSVIVPYPAFQSGLLTVFSGLTLGPGTYWLTVTGTAGDFALIGENPSPTVVLDPGVTILGYAIDCCTPSAYIPSQVNPWVFSAWGFEVTGVSAVPEPGSGLLALAPLGLLWYLRARQK